MRKGSDLVWHFFQLGSIWTCLLVGTFLKDGRITFPLMMAPSTFKYHTSGLAIKSTSLNFRELVVELFCLCGKM